MFKFRKSSILLLLITGIFLLSACGSETGEGATEENNSENEENQEQEETFDVHGIELKEKEEPEKIEEEEVQDPEESVENDVDDVFKLSEERMKEIAKAIINQDEETLRKHNYFGDRVLDENIEQTVYMKNDEADSDDPMENDNNEKDFSEYTFDNAIDYIAFQNDFEAETNKDFQDSLDEIQPKVDENHRPTFYRTEDILEYADHEGLTDINLDEYEIKATSGVRQVEMRNGDYTFGGMQIKIEKEDQDDVNDDYYIFLHFNKYKDGYYYINGVEIS